MHRPSPLPAAPIDGLARHRDYLRARLRGLGVSDANLDDAVQDVFEVLVRRIGDYDSRFSLRQWMAGVARKVASRHREHERRAPALVDEARIAAPVPDPEHAAARREGLAVLQRFLAGLDADRWAVFVLSEIEGLRGTEIAAELEVNLSTVYARLRTARQAFEQAAAAQRGPGRSWLGSLFAAPSGLFRRTGDAAFTTPLVLVALGTLGLGAAFGARGCGDTPDGADDEIPTSAPAQPRGTATPGGIAGRASDSAATLARTPVADAEGWFNGGGGRSERSAAGDALAMLLMHRASYRLEGAELALRVVYSNDGPSPAGGFGWLDLDGFDLVEGTTQWPTALAVGEVRELRWRLRARRAGPVAVTSYVGPQLRGAGWGASVYHFVFEGGALRRCDEGECDEKIASIAEAATGETISLHLHNDCDRAIELAQVPVDVDVPPPDAPRIHLAAGERRSVRSDVALGFMRRRDDGRHGSKIWTDTPGSIIRFSGARCESVRSDSP